MASRVGPSPWSEQFRRATKRNAADYEWSLSSGWRARRYGDKWFKDPNKAKYKEITLYNGRIAKVPDADFEDFLAHQASDRAAADSEVAKFISEAKWTQEVVGVGHIDNIAYAPMRQLLEVSFAEDQGGAVVVFFRVPKEVYSELRSLALGGETRLDKNGVERHLLGIRFWDIVRIRGNHTGARYRFEYIKGSTKAVSELEAEFESEEGYGVAQDKQKEDSSWMNRLATNLLKEQNPKAYTEYDKAGTNNERAAILKKYGVM